MIVQTCTADEASGTRAPLPHGLHPVEAPATQRARVAGSEVADLRGGAGGIEHDRSEVPVRPAVPRGEVVAGPDDATALRPRRQRDAADRDEAPGRAELTRAGAPDAAPPHPDREGAVEGSLHPHSVTPGGRHAHRAHDLAR